MAEQPSTPAVDQAKLAEFLNIKNPVQIPDALLKSPEDLMKLSKEELIEMVLSNSAFIFQYVLIDMSMREVDKTRNECFFIRSISQNNAHRNSILQDDVFY